MPSNQIKNLLLLIGQAVYWLSRRDNSMVVCYLTIIKDLFALTQFSSRKQRRRYISVTN